MKAFLSLTINLLTTITKHLELKGKSFSVFESTRDNEITAFWEVLNITDNTLTMNDTNLLLIKKEKLKSFFERCCEVQVLYVVYLSVMCASLYEWILKCLRIYIFSKLEQMIIIFSFAKIYGTKTTDDCPSQAKRKKNKVNYLFA